MPKLNLEFDTVGVSQDRFWDLPHDIINPESGLFTVKVTKYMPDGRIALLNGEKIVAILFLESK